MSPPQDPEIAVSLQGPWAGSAPLVALALPSETVAALCQRLLQGAPPLPPLSPPMTMWLLSTRDGAWYTERPLETGERVGAIQPGASEVVLALYGSMRCMHGSPGVLGRGHLCGWC